MQTLNQDQYRQLMNMISSHLTSAKVDTGADSMHSNQVSGFVQPEDDWQGVKDWLIYTY